eukprot:7308428-Alexandrium_andersonii.AAC.1
MEVLGALVSPPPVPPAPSPVPGAAVPGGGPGSSAAPAASLVRGAGVAAGEPPARRRRLGGREGLDAVLAPPGPGAGGAGELSPTSPA